MAYFGSISQWSYRGLRFQIGSTTTPQHITTSAIEQASTEKYDFYWISSRGAAAVSVKAYAYSSQATGLSYQFLIIQPIAFA